LLWQEITPANSLTVAGGAVRFVVLLNLLLINAMKIEELVFMTIEELLSRYRAGQRDFRNLNLIAANLRNVNLSGANLSGANLTRANLTKTNLSYANLSDAVITGANLTETSLVKANLTNADLSEVQLGHADLRGAIMRDVVR
jgi:uncharacterized protein YjbI with pentapeptide repeats